METGLTREEALQALQTYNHAPFHLQHALTVEAIMGWFAKEEGFEAGKRLLAHGGAAA